MMAWQYDWLGAAHQQDSRGAGVLDAGVSCLLPHFGIIHCVPPPLPLRDLLLLGLIWVRVDPRGPDISPLLWL
jgi:hypothetical protein